MTELRDVRGDDAEPTIPWAKTPDVTAICDIDTGRQLPTSVYAQKADLMTIFRDRRLKRMGENVPDLEQLGKNRNNEWVSIRHFIGIHHLADQLQFHFDRNTPRHVLLEYCCRSIVGSEVMSQGFTQQVFSANRQLQNRCTAPPSTF